jgi:hypothetical protein
MRPLDAYLPQYEFSERHSVVVDAPPEHIDRALREVTVGDVPVVHALMALRGMGRGAREIRFLERLARRGVVLDDVSGEGVVLGLAGQFWRLRGGDGPVPRTAAEFAEYDRADACKAVTDFRVGAGGRLSTETRVHVRDPHARRKFALYWRVIRPFSGLIRIVLLRAAKRRAEAAAA